MSFIDAFNDFLWSYLLIVALLGCAAWFTWKTRFVQFRLMGEMVRLLGDSASSGGKPGQKRISSFQAFAVSLASRVGTGNLAGVATAIVVGGPGAVFWMWIIALIGSANAFVESTLAQLYKLRGKDSFVGGPAYYMRIGLKRPWMGSLFAGLIIVTFGLAFNTVQSNTLCAAFESAFGFDHRWTGFVLLLSTMLIIFGGVQRIARFSSIVVPLMALGYLLVTVVVLLLNISQIPAMVKLIVESAFGWEPAVGGGIGAALMQGIKRGLFSNEAGMGSAPNAAATAHTSHPVKQGLIQSLGVFTDTLVICSCTAFIILTSGVPLDGTYNGIQLTQAALQQQIGPFGSLLIAFAIAFFAFSSIIGNYYYGETNINYLTSRRSALFIYRLVASFMVLFGALTTLETAWTLADICMGLMTLCNLVAIAQLGRYAFRLLNDYQSQKRQGIREPCFRKETMPDIAAEIECLDDEDASNR